MMMSSGCSEVAEDAAQRDAREASLSPDSAPYIRYAGSTAQNRAISSSKSIAPSAMRRSLRQDANVSENATASADNMADAPKIPHRNDLHILS
jgi:hypothetical protein